MYSQDIYHVFTCPWLVDLHQTALSFRSHWSSLFSHLVDMLEVFILSLLVMQEEVSPFGLEINWSKTNIQTTVDPLPATQQAQVDGNVVDMVDSFTYLGSLVDQNGRSKAELVRRKAIARNCMTSLERNIWLSSISVPTKIRLYSVYVLPVFLYGQ